MRIEKLYQGQWYIFNIQTTMPVFEIGSVKIYITKSEEGGKYIVTIIDPNYYVNLNSIEKYDIILNNKNEWFIDGEETALNIAMKLKMVFEYKENMNTLCEMVEEIETNIVHCDQSEITITEEF